jgi:hypothetical protein
MTRFVTVSSSRMILITGVIIGLDTCHGVSIVYLVIPWHALPLICNSALLVNLCIPNVTFLCCQNPHYIIMWDITSGSVHKVICDNFVLGFVNLFAHFAVSLHIDASPPSPNACIEKECTSLKGRKISDSVRSILNVLFAVNTVCYKTKLLLFLFFIVLNHILHYTLKY